MNLKQLKRQEEKLDKRIAQYLAELDEADKAEAGEVVEELRIQLGSDGAVRRLETPLLLVEK